jgi:hypothetical protein
LAGFLVELNNSSKTAWKILERYQQSDFCSQKGSIPHVFLIFAVIQMYPLQIAGVAN